MSWLNRFLPTWKPAVISCELCDHSGEPIGKQTIQYGSLESGTIKDKKRSNSIIPRGSGDLKSHHVKNSSFASQSSLLGLLHDQKDKNEWRAIPNTAKPVIRQPEKDSPSILPFFNNKSKLNLLAQPPIQKEYIETIKTQFFNLGISTGASLQ